MKLVGGGYVINGTYPIKFFNVAVFVKNGFYVGMQLKRFTIWWHLYKYIEEEKKHYFSPPI